VRTLASEGVLVVGGWGIGFPHSDVRLRGWAVTLGAAAPPMMRRLGPERRYIATRGGLFRRTGGRVHRARHRPIPHGWRRPHIRSASPRRPPPRRPAGPPVARSRRAARRPPAPPCPRARCRLT
jgi:hypothetical protein